MTTLTIQLVCTLKEKGEVKNGVLQFSFLQIYKLTNDLFHYENGVPCISEQSSLKGIWKNCKVQHHFQFSPDFGRHLLRLFFP